MGTPWQSVSELLHAALDLAPEARARFIESQSTDEQVRKEALRLLRTINEGDAGFLSAGPVLLASELVRRFQRSGATASAEDAGASPSFSSAPHEDPAMAAGALAPACVLANRFRILNFLARGGMGEVYAAEDLRGGGKVALKTIRARGATNMETLERFRREVLSAKNVTHANVCRIYDLHHHLPDANPGGVPTELAFYTMELLEGETLSQAIARAGTVPPRQALAILTQIAAGLEAIHAAGIIHRDLKSGNVMLVSGVPGSPLAVKITDFGLARAAEPVGESFLSASGAVFGTPEYMAPEVLLQMNKASRASDIYSLGVIAYQMLTGRLPVWIHRKFSRAAPVAPSALAREVPRRWDAPTLRCLERDPSRRFLSAAAFVDALTGRRHATLRWIAAMAAVLLLICAVAFGYIARERLFHAAGKRPLIAILGFKDLESQAPAGLSDSFATGLAAELRAAEDVDVVPGEDIAHLKMNFHLPEAESYSRDTLRRIHDNTGASLVLLGSYLASEQPPSRKVRLYLLAQKTDSGETVASLEEDGSPDSLLDVITKTVDDLRAGLGLRPRSPEAERLARSSLPHDPEALRFYAEGLQRAHTFDLDGACTLFRRAIAIDVSYAPAHAELAEALSEMGHDQEARAESTKALDLSRSLPREQRLLTEGEYYDIHAQRPQAAERFRTLFDFFDENLYYGLLLTSVQDAHDATGTIARLRKLPAPLCDDPRIDVWDAVTAGNLDQFKRQQELASRAAEKARQRGAPGQVAEALIQQGLAERNLGNPEKAAPLFEQAKHVNDELHDYVMSAKCLRLLAGLSFEAGNFEVAWKTDSEVLEIGHRIGSAVSQARTLDAMGDIRFAEGRLAQAEDLYNQSLSLWRSEDASLHMAAEQLSLARIYLLRGKAAQAGPAFKDALRTFRELGDKSSELQAQTNIVNFLIETGDMAGAERAAAAASALQRDLGSAYVAPTAELAKARVLRDGNSISDALATATQAANGYESTGQNANLAEARLEIALLNIDSGRLTAAESLAGQASAQFQKEGAAQSAPAALAMQALAQLSAGDRAGAVSTMQRATAGLDQLEDRLTTDFVRTVNARVWAAAGNLTGARRTLKEVIENAVRDRLVLDRLEAALALSEIERRADRQLATEAQRLGYVRIAARARQVSQWSP